MADSFVLRVDIGSASAVAIPLTREDLADLVRDVPAGAAGDRYPSQAMAMLDR
jgi:hypothetical protein